jgi:hypothetical protein
MCQMHYRRAQKGTPLDAPKAPGKGQRPRALWVGGPCMIDGCGKPAVTRKMCNGHYRRSMKGRPLLAPWRPGGRKPHPWTARGLEILADGEWHDYNRLVTAMAAVVPPNVARAHMQEWSTSPLNKRAAREAAGRPARESRRRLHTMQHELRSARRDLVWRRLYDLWKQDRIEIEPPPVRGRGDEHYGRIRNRRVRLRNDGPQEARAARPGGTSARTGARS